MTDGTVAVDSGDIWPVDAADVEEAVLANWFVPEGARVEAGATLCEMQIEKVSIDVPAPVAGTLAERVVDENDVFERGDVLARLSPDDSV